MPSKSPKQARMMAAAAHNPEFAQKVGVSQKVAEEFNEADAGTGIINARRQISSIIASRKRPGRY